MDAHEILGGARRPPELGGNPTQKPAMPEKPLGVLQTSANLDYVARDAPPKFMDAPGVRAKNTRLSGR
jgi:hypothetical protein